MLDLVWLIPALPLAGFCVLLVAGRRFGEPLAGWLATAAVAASFAATAATFVGLLAEPAEERFFGQTLFEWIPAGSFRVDVGFFVDPLALTMALFVTGIATLIHLYSIGYMHGDEKFSKFFLYLNLFVFSMLMLVLGDNMLLTFLGWEGVGVCSYFLISFWFADPANASAGKKAFVTNRIGDWGFMIAIFLTFVSVGSIRWVDVLAEAPTLPATTATAIAVLLFVGAIGKSAQLPLYVWLPDAMAGPTPVSALIHAATMVTAGVFLMTRSSPVLAAADSWAPNLVAWVGALTALFAATIAVAQSDIKKVLAYSTISQLGYLFLAVGVGAYVAAIFHMVTHAFFKALLFLGAGSVIHGLDDTQDMRKMGGLAKLMPFTASTFIVGWLAIAGVPPFSGFWSKDEILAYAWNDNKLLWIVGLVTALLTAFYMTRQVVMTFFGRSRFGDPTLAELQAAWDNRLAAEEEQLAAVVAAPDAAGTALDDARANLEVRQQKVLAAEADVATATAALDGLAESDERDEATKTLDKATKALARAQGDLTKAIGAVPVAEEAFTSARVDADDAERRLGELREEVRVKRPSTEPGDLQAIPDTSEVDTFLPESVHARREYHPHESPPTMTIPLGLLAVGAVVAGALNLPFTKDLHFLEHWLEPSLFGHEAHLSFGGGTLWMLAIVATSTAAAGIAIAFGTYLLGRFDRRRFEAPILERAWGVDSAYATFVAGPGTALFEAAARFDRVVVDGAVNGAGTLIRTVSTRMRTVQTGFVRTYALTLAVGVLVLVGYVVSRASL